LATSLRSDAEVREHLRGQLLGPIRALRFESYDNQRCGMLVADHPSLEAAAVRRAER
jgi:hypothetical protein